MIDNVKPKEATSIINSLIGGVVPKMGVQHITVGRTEEINAVISALEDVKNGHSMVKFWFGQIFHASSTEYRGIKAEICCCQCRFYT